MPYHQTIATPLNIVAVSGGLNSPSKTESLIQAILDELSEAISIKVHFIKLSEIGPYWVAPFTVTNYHSVYRMTLPQLRRQMP